MSIHIGDKVQVWSETEYKCLGWGTIIRLVISVKNKEETPLIQLESGKTIWGDSCSWITEEAAVKAGIRIWNVISQK